MIWIGHRSLQAFWRVLFAFCLLALSMGPVMSEPAKFDLVAGLTPDATFAFDDPLLDFASAAPAGFNRKANTGVPGEFIDSAMFSAFEERFIGYDPLNRDRLEIRIYEVMLVPERVALAADYARLLASRWGALNFGVKAHNPDFGEVFAGDDRSGAMQVNRISVIRRGDRLLVIRAAFPAEHFATVGTPLAGFLGSIAFAQPMAEDKIRATFRPDAIGPVGSGLTLAYQMPGNWQRLPLDAPPREQGQYHFWTDASDPAGDAAVMVGRVQIMEGMRINPASPDPQAMANYAGLMAQVLIKTALGDPDTSLQPQVMDKLPALQDITQFHALYTFKALIGPEKTELSTSILVSLGKDGTLLVAGAFSPFPTTQYHMGTMMHANMAIQLQIEAQTAFWTQAANE